MSIYVVHFEHNPCEASVGITGQVLAPALKELNAQEILLQYGGLATNVPCRDVLRCVLATQVRPRDARSICGLGLTRASTQN